MRYISMAFLAVVASGLTSCGRTTEVSMAIDGEEAEAAAALLELDVFGVPTRWEGPPPSWGEWVEKQQAFRPRDINVYRPSFMPDMSRWRAADFLPAGARQGPFISRCELPDAEQERILGADAYSAEGRAALRPFAERGVVLAMAKLAEGHCSIRGEGMASNMRDGLTWARRAAASGSQIGMSMLTSCMSKIQLGRSQELSEVVNVPLEQLHPRGFWEDEMLYWLWRSAHTLDAHSLFVLLRGVDNHYMPSSAQDSSDSERFSLARVERYKWARLSDIGKAFTGEIISGTEDLLQQYPETTEAEIAEGERRVAEFLRRHGGELRRAQLSGYGCPGGPSKKLDYAALNQELARYGLHVEPERPWKVPQYPIPVAGPLQ